MAQARLDRPLPDRRQGLGQGARQGLDEAEPSAKEYQARSQAEEALRGLLTAEAAGVKAASGLTFDQVADAYLQSLAGRIRSASFRACTLRTYENIVAKPRWGSRPIADVTAEEIADYRAELAVRNLAASTVNQTRSIVHGIFVVAVERFGLEDDPSVAFKRATRRGHLGQDQLLPT